MHYGLDELPPAWAENPPLALDGPLLLAVCRLEPQKGLDTALRSLADVPDATLLVLGEGPDRAALESLRVVARRARAAPPSRAASAT